MNAIDYNLTYRSDGTVNQCSCTVTFEVSSGIATGDNLPEQQQFIVIDLLSGDGGGSRDKIDLNTCTLTISDSYSYGQVGSLTYTIKNASGRDLVENTDFVVLKDTSFMYPSIDYFSVTVSLSGIGDYTGTIQATKNNVYAFVYMRMNVVLDGQIVGSPKTYVSFNDKEYDSSRPTEGAIQWGHIDTNITHSLKRPFDPTTDNISYFWNTFNSYGSFRYTTNTPIVSETFTVVDSSKYQIDGVYYGLVGAGGSNPVGAPAATDKNIKYTSSTDGITVQTSESINRPESMATNTYNMLVMVSSKST